MFTIHEESDACKVTVSRLTVDMEAIHGDCLEEQPPDKTCNNPHMFNEHARKWEEMNRKSRLPFDNICPPV